MNFIEIFKSSFQSLISNKMRSLLTMLGIIIGIASVIAMSAIGSGGEQSITGSLAKSGFGLYQISTDSDAENYRSIYDLNDKDLNIIKNGVEGIESVAPVLRERVSINVPNGRNIRGSINGGTSDYDKMQEVEIVQGRNILNLEYDQEEPVIIIDDYTAKMLYPDETPLNKKVTIRIWSLDKNVDFTIVGVSRHSLTSMMSLGGVGRNVPLEARVPMTLLEKVSNSKTYSSIMIMPADPLQADQVLSDTMNILEEKNTEGIYEASEVVARGEELKNILKTLNLFIVAVASISLLVGGIGVMNIMLVSVTERVKEIGIRKAIGAKNIHILLQFMTEAVLLALIGGVIGIIIGMVGANIICSFIDLQPIFSVTIIIISFLTSTLIGIIFGVYPARQASLLNPIEALRTE